MDRRRALFALGCSGIAVDAAAGGSPPPASESSANPGAYVVSPAGPRDGGDFGPNTPGTMTSGLQEAFDACKRDRRDLTIVGGAVAEPFGNPGGVYSLQETLRIPWMQDFRCDGGEAVLQYTAASGDAILMDSQMSCVYKFGLIALPSGQTDGACLRVLPQSAGPDRLVGVVASRFEINALVGAGSRGLERESFVASGDGLVLDSSHGGIGNNCFFIQEILGCARGVYMTAPGPRSAVLNNWIECPFAHICQTHFQLGDAGMESGVLWNRLEAHIDSQNLAQSMGVRIFGRGNWLKLTLLQISEKRGVVFEPGARENSVDVGNLLGRYTDSSGEPSNRIRTWEVDGLGVSTPTVPDSGTWMENPYPAAVEVIVLEPGEIRLWRRQLPGQDALEFEAPWLSGQSIVLWPHERLCAEFAAPPKWLWRPI